MEGGDGEPTESASEPKKKKKGILRKRGERCSKKKQVDFDLKVEFVPFDEAKDYTVEIQIVEKLPPKIVSYAALFAQQKEEEEKKIREEEEKKKKKGKRVKTEAGRKDAVVQDEEGTTENEEPESHSEVECNALEDGLEASREIIEMKNDQTEELKDQRVPISQEEDKEAGANVAVVTEPKITNHEESEVMETCSQFHEGDKQDSKTPSSQAEESKEAELSDSRKEEVDESNPNPAPMVTRDETPDVETKNSVASSEEEPAFVQAMQQDQIKSEYQSGEEEVSEETNKPYQEEYEKEEESRYVPNIVSNNGTEISADDGEMTYESTKSGEDVLEEEQTSELFEEPLQAGQRDSQTPESMECSEEEMDEEVLEATCSDFSEVALEEELSEYAELSEENGQITESLEEASRGSEPERPQVEISSSEAGVEKDEAPNGRAEDDGTGGPQLLDRAAFTSKLSLCEIDNQRVSERLSELSQV